MGHRGRFSVCSEPPPGLVRVITILVACGPPRSPISGCRAGLTRRRYRRGSLSCRAGRRKADVDAWCRTWSFARRAIVRSRRASPFSTPSGQRDLPDPPCRDFANSSQGRAGGLRPPPGSSPPSSDMVYFVEVGLSGEVRQIAQAELRLKEAAKLGFQPGHAAPPVDPRATAPPPRQKGLRLDEIGAFCGPSRAILREGPARCVTGPSRGGAMAKDAVSKDWTTREPKRASPPMAHVPACRGTPQPLTFGAAVYLLGVKKGLTTRSPREGFGPKHLRVSEPRNEEGTLMATPDAITVAHLVPARRNTRRARAGRCSYRQ